MQTIGEKIIREYCEDFLQYAYGGRHHYMINIETGYSLSGEKSYSLSFSPISPYWSKGIYKNLLKYLETGDKLYGCEMIVNNDPNHTTYYKLYIRQETLLTIRKKKINKIKNGINRNI